MALSQMMAQYLNIKEKHSDCIVFFRLGDFYEMFYEDAKIASVELDLTLTGRDCGLENKAEMCGIPYHAADSYLAKLISKGYKVAICEQLSEPTIGKGIVERDVVRIMTPGTVTESSMLDSNSNNYIMSVFWDEDEIGVSWADITTGEFNFLEIRESSLNELKELISRVAPSEILCNDKIFNIKNSLKNSYNEGHELYNILSNDKYDYLTNRNTILEDIGSEIFNKILQNPPCIRSSGSLLEYLRFTQKKHSIHFEKISNNNENNVVLINSTARKTLELIETSGDKKKKGSLLWFLDNTKTSLGARKLKKWLEQPSKNELIINRRLDAVEELIGENILREELSNELSNIKDIERISSKITIGSVNPRECILLSQSLTSCLKIKAILKLFESHLISANLNKIYDFSETINLIDSAIEPECPLLIRDGNVIKQSFDEQLDEYRDISQNSKKILAELEQVEKSETGIKTLKIGFNRIFGYYIEISKSQLDLVPYRYIRKQTVANGERYITEELKEIEEKILNSEALYKKREIELYEAIVSKLKESISLFMEVSDFISELDCINSFAFISIHNNFTRPIINKNINQIKISEGRHCVVEKILDEGCFVPNDTLLDNNHNKINIITGPNMSGKSIYMRQVALIVVLAHMGCFVPAKSSEICLIDKILTRVGANDDLSTGRSTFMVEMTEVADIISKATDRSLILLDEVGRGTSTYDGLSIAWSILEYMTENLNSIVLFSTHYHELTELEDRYDCIKNYKFVVKEVNNSIIFLRKLLRGSANKSFGIEVAKLAGLPQNIISNAQKILKSLELSDITKNIRQHTSRQISVFSSTASTEISKILFELDLDNISPKQSYEILNDLAEKAKKERL